MGKALYREYRPKKLSEVVGQEHITTTLSNALEKGAIAHAYMFTGPRGVGKTSIARILAHEINELDYQDDSTHLDIIEIDAASNRRIDEIRDLREKVHIAPTSAKYKVYIIDEVHMLTREAFNALLKTLEEPPEHVVFILATTEAHKVPDTIVSRTQRFTFKPIDNADAVTHLRAIADKEKLKITDEALSLLAEHGKGSFRDSISMLDQIAGFGHDTITADVLRDLIGIPNETLLNDVIDAVSAADTDKLFSSTLSLRTQGAHPSLIAQSLIKNLRDHIAEKRLVLSHTQTVHIMKNLLPLTGGYSSYEAIEIVLLDAIELPSSESGEAQTKAASEKSNIEKSKKEATDALLEHKAIHSAEELPNVGQVKQNSKDWPAVLDALKGHHNTLYGVLRMAKASVGEGRLDLAFQFSFHHKQATQAKHMQVLRETAESILGSPLEIVMIVSSDAHNETKSTPIDAPTVDLQSVSNIFGGAELLES